MIIAQIIMMLMLINIKSNVEHHQDFEKNNGWINSIDPYVGFCGILDVGQAKKHQMMRDK